jgi:hypothetical protein
MSLKHEKRAQSCAIVIRDRVCDAMNPDSGRSDLNPGVSITAATDAVILNPGVSMIGPIDTVIAQPSCRPFITDLSRVRSSPAD